jgi:hypothetical protein
MYSLSIGSGSVRLSFGGIHGMSLAKIANAEYRAALLRTTWARQSLLVSLEIRAEDLKQVVQRREFNELGNATVTFETEKRVVPAAALRVSMRIR